MISLLSTSGLDEADAIKLYEEYGGTGTADNGTQNGDFNNDGAVDATDWLVYLKGLYTSNYNTYEDAVAAGASSSILTADEWAANGNSADDYQKYLTKAVWINNWKNEGAGSNKSDKVETSAAEYYKSRVEEQNGIQEKINSLFAKSNQFINDYNERYANGNTVYRTPEETEAYCKEVAAQADSLIGEAKELKNGLNDYSEVYDSEILSQTIEQLDNCINAGMEIVQNAKDDKAFWAKFENEDKYELWKVAQKKKEAEFQAAVTGIPNPNIEKYDGIINEYVKKNLSKEEQAQIRASDIFGKINGNINDDYSTTSSNRSTLNVSNNLFTKAAGNELLNAAEGFTPEEKQTLQNFVNDYLKTTLGDKYASVVKKYSFINNTTDTDSIYSMIAADYCFDVLNNASTWYALTKKDGTLAKNVAMWYKQYAADVTENVKEQNDGSKGLLSNDATTLSKAAEHWNDVVDIASSAKRFIPEAYEDKEALNEKALDRLQFKLDLIGLAPVVGDAVDGLNAVISLARGNYLDAALSVAAMAPIAGWGAAAAKGVKYGIEAVDAASTALKYSDEAYDIGKDIFKYGDEAVDFGEDLFKYGDDIIDAGDGIIKYGDEAVDFGEDFFKYDDDIIDAGEDFTKYADDGFDAVENVGDSWYKVDGSLNLPPDYGAVKGTEKIIDLQPGSKLGRFGVYGKSSDFVTAPGSAAETLSLPPYTDTSIYQEFTVLKPIPGATQSTVAPWGGSVGGGTQFRLPMTIQELLDGGYIK